MADSTPQSQVNKSHRMTMRLYPDDYNALVYWSEAFEMDRTEFLVTAMYHYIKWRNQDYDLPTAEMQRLNQLTDAIQSLIVSNEHLEQTTINGMDSLIGIIRGGNYLVDDEDGEL